MSLAALVLAAPPVPGLVKRGLLERLGPEGAAALHELLVRRTLEWSAAVAPGRAYVATAAGAWPAGLEVAGVERFDQAQGDIAAIVGAAVERVAERHDGPLLCVSTDVPALGEHHARAATGDLLDGCDIAFGPCNDGGCYMLGLARPQLHPGLAEALAGARRPEIIGRGLAVAATGARVGLLRSERELHTEADVDALLADPAAPADVVRLLQR